MEIHGNSPDCLYSVSVDGNALDNGKTCQPLHRLDSTGLVIRKHQRCQPRPFVKLSGHELSIGNTFGIDRRSVNVELIGLEVAHCLRNGGMLDWTGN